MVTLDLLSLHYTAFSLYIGVGTMGAPGAGAPLFSDCYIARLNFIHSDHTALAYS